LIYLELLLLLSFYSQYPRLLKEERKKNHFKHPISCKITIWSVLGSGFSLNIIIFIIKSSSYHFRDSFQSFQRIIVSILIYFHFKLDLYWFLVIDDGSLWLYMARFVSLLTRLWFKMILVEKWKYRMNLESWVLLKTSRLCSFILVWCCVKVSWLDLDIWWSKMVFKWSLDRVLADLGMISTRSSEVSSRLESRTSKISLLTDDLVEG
jgi:hypothetical protein